MYICGKFTKDNAGALSRKTSAKVREVVITPEGKSPKCDVVFNAENNKLEVTAGKYITCATDVIGISEQATLSFILMRDGFIVKLLDGAMYINDGGTQVAKLLASGANSPATAAKIYWLKAEDLPSYLKFSIAQEFSVPYDGDLKDYINNLEFVCTVWNQTEKGVHTFHFHCDEIRKTLGKSDFVSNTTDKPFNVNGSNKKSSLLSLIDDAEECDPFDAE
jgi:hypothetical protein